MRQWKDLFQAHTLKCGLSDYEDGFISSLKETPTGYHAYIDEPEEYHVEIEMQNKVVSKMTCTCPTGKKGHYCEHMAAALYEIEETTQPIKIATSSLKTMQKEEKALKKIISNISTEELQEMIYSLTLSDENIYNMIMIKYAPITKKQMTKLKNLVDKICYQYFEDDYVDYYQLKDSLNQLLQQYIPLLLDRQYRIEAFEFINYVFYQIGTQNVSDSLDLIDFIGNTCYKYWQIILKESNKEEIRQMYEWFLKHQEQDVTNDLAEYIYDFLLYELHDVTTIQKQLHRLDNMIEQNKNENYSGDSFSAHYGVINNITSRIQLMEQLNKPKTEILNYRMKHRHFNEIKDMEIQEYLSDHNYQKAIAILNESKQLDIAKQGFGIQYSEQLIQIYEELQMQKEYKEELEYHIFNFVQSNSTYLLKLKELYNEAEWVTLREKFLDAQSSQWIKYEFLVEEGLFERLLKEIQKDNALYLLDQYEEILKEQIPNEVINFLTQYLNDTVAQASTRYQVKDLIYQLYKLTHYPNGKKIAKDIIASWKETYCNHTLLLEELRKSELIKLK